MKFSIKDLLDGFQKPSTLINSAVGIDIGRSSVKVVELKRSSEGPVLVTYGEIQLGPYANEPIGSAVEVDSTIHKKAIVDVLREAGVSTNNATLSLPLKAGFVTVVDIARREKESLESKIPIEARKYVPLPLPETSLDWSPVRDEVEYDNGELHQDVLLVALPNETVRGYKQLLRSIEFANQPMELGLFSASRSIGAARYPAVALIDFGAAVSKLYIYQAGAVAAIHRFKAGGVMVTEQLVKQTRLSFSDAEEFKRDPQLEETQQAAVRKATHTVFDQTLREIRRILQKFEMTHKIKVAQVVLSGSVSQTVGFPHFVGDTLQRPVTKAFPFGEIGYPAFLEDSLRGLGPTFTNSLGAALRLLL